MKPSIRKLVDLVKAGDADAALRLFCHLHGNTHPFLKIARKQTPATNKLLFLSLSHELKLELSSPSGEVAQPEGSVTTSTKNPRVRHPEGSMTEGSARAGQRFREQYPFLSSPSCPQELKILAADKITAYHKYTSLHPQLCDLTEENDEQVTSDLVESFIENRRIHRELTYYGKHKKVLGLHPIFKEYEQIRELKQLSILQLVEKKKNLEHNIWRIQSELNKGTKPHLQPERERSMQEKKRLLQLVEDLLNEKGK